MSSIPNVDPQPQGRAVRIGIWAVKILFAVVFFGAGTAKLVGVPMLVTEFDTIGLGQWFRYVTGAIEIIGAALLLWPAKSAVGALLLTCVSVGAFFAQVLILHMDFVHTLVFAIVMGTLAWLGRSQLRIR